MKDKKIKLNLGCASRFLPGYINVDMDSLDQIKKRYPDINFDLVDNINFLQADVLRLPLMK